jgi:transposase
VSITADNLPDDLAALKRIIATMAQDALTAQAEIARLKFQLARYRRAEFGRSSEQLAREAEQLELAANALAHAPARYSRRWTQRRHRNG